MLWLLWAALDASLNTAHIYIRNRRQMRMLGFAKTPFLLECLALGLKMDICWVVLLNCVQNAQ
jgi:hypothetical protein